MSTNTLNYAINFRADSGAFVKGLDAIQRKSAATGKYIETSFNTLEMRPFKGVDKDILRLKTAFNALKNSGKLSIGELTKAEAQLKIKTRELKAETSGWATQMGQAKTGLLALAGGVYAAGKAFTSFSGFGQKMAEVNTLLDVSQTRFKGLSDEILDMTGRLPMAAQDLAAAEYDIISAGVALGNSTAVLEMSAKAATAGVTDTKTAVGAGLSVINAYGQGVDKLDETYDILFQTVKKGVTTFPELAAGIGDVLPQARAADESFKGVGAALATMTKAGIKTPKALTGLKGLFTALSAPSEEIRKKLKAQGLEWNGLDDTIRRFAEANLGPAALRELVPDVEARTAVLALSQNYDTLKETLAGMDQATGSMQAAYAKMKDTPANQIKIFTNEVNQLKIGLGAALSEGLLPTAKGLTFLINGYQAAGPVTQGFTNLLLTGVTGLTAWHLGLEKVWTSMKLARAHMLMTTASVAGFNTLLSVALPLAVGVAVFQLGRLALEWYKLSQEEKKAEEAHKLRLKLLDEQGEKLNALGKELGINIASEKEYYELKKVGAIVLDEATGKLKLNFELYIKYHAGLLKVEDAEKKVAEAVSKTAEEMIVAAKTQTKAQVELEKFILGLAGAGEGVKSYELTLVDLKLALATGVDTQEEYNTKTLAATKKHWAEMVKTLEKAVAESKVAMTKGQGSYEDYEKAVLALREAQINAANAEAAVKDAVDATGDSLDKNKQRLKDALDGWQAVVDEGVANYTLALTALDIALAKGLITEAQYHERSLRAEKDHWIKMVATRKAALATMAAAGLRDTEKYKDTVQELRDAELELINTENRLRQEVFQTSRAMNVSESAWASFAEKVGLTVDELKDIVTPAALAAEAGRKAATVSESAWASFARQVGLTTEELKNAVAEISDDIEAARGILDDFNEKWSGKFISVGADGYFEQKFGNVKEMTLDALKDLNEEMKQYQKIWFGGGWWDQYNANLAKYKIAISNAIVELKRQEQKLLQEQLAEEERAKNQATLDLYKKRRDAHQAMVDAIIAKKDELLAKLTAVVAAQEAMNQAIADQERDIARETMSASETYADDQANVAGLLSKAKQAYAQGDYETAKFYLNETLSANTAFNKDYVETLADGSKKVIANEQQVRDTRLDFLKDIQSLSDNVNDAAKEELNTEITVNDEQLQNAYTILQDINTQIDDIMGKLDTDMTLKANIDAKSAWNVIGELQEPTFSTHTVNIKTKGGESGLDLPQLNIPQLNLPQILLPESQRSAGAQQPPGETFNLNLSLEGASASGVFQRNPDTQAFLDELNALSLASR